MYFVELLGIIDNHARTKQQSALRSIHNETLFTIFSRCHRRKDRSDTCTSTLLRYSLCLELQCRSEIIAPQVLPRGTSEQVRV